MWGSARGLRDGGVWVGGLGVYGTQVLHSACDDFVWLWFGAGRVGLCVGGCEVGCGRQFDAGLIYSEFLESRECLLRESLDGKIRSCGVVQK